MIVAVGVVMLVIMIMVVVMMTMLATMRVGHGDMIVGLRMVMLVYFMEVRFINLFVQMLMTMFMRVQMYVYMRIGPMNMTMGMEKFPNDITVFLIHLLFDQDIMQKLMGHKRERHLEFVFLEQTPIIEDLLSEAIAFNAAVREQ